MQNSTGLFLNSLLNLNKLYEKIKKKESIDSKKVKIGQIRVEE
jgi:hypothetical protein